MSRPEKKNIPEPSSSRFLCSRGAAAPMRIQSSSVTKSFKNPSFEMTELEFRNYDRDISDEKINLMKKGLDAKSLIADPESNIILKSYLKKQKGNSNSWLSPDVLSTIECYELATKLYNEEMEPTQNNFLILRKLCPNSKSDKCVADAINGNKYDGKQCLKWLINECIDIIEIDSDFRDFIHQFLKEV